jgi:hypothetical protein
MVPGYEFPSTQCTMIHIFVIITLHMTLYVGVGDGSFPTESTDIGIFASMDFMGKFVCFVIWGVACGCT